MGGGDIAMSESKLCPECRHIFPNGKRCHANALRGEPLCYHHSRKTNLVRHNRQRDHTVALPPLEDRGAIQMALDAVLAALAADKLDKKTVWPYLVAIQSASHNLTRAKEELVAAEQVEEIEEVNGQNFAPQGSGDAPVEVEEPGEWHKRGYTVPKIDASSHECDREKPLPQYESVEKRPFYDGKAHITRADRELWKKSDDWVKQFNAGLAARAGYPVSP